MTVAMARVSEPGIFHTFQNKVSLSLFSQVVGWGSDFQQMADNVGRLFAG